MLCSIETSNILDNGSSLNGSKIYGIVDKTNIIYNLCDLKLLNNKADIFTLLDMHKNNYQKKRYLFNIDGTVNYDDLDEKEKNEKPKSKKKSNISDKIRYKVLMKTAFKEIKSEMKEFFDFLGSYNKTGNIADSRKVKILEATKEYADEDIVYAMNLTMRNTVSGNNPYRERYFLKILKNLYEEENTDDVNDVAVKLSKKADEKLKANNKNNKPNNNNGSKTKIDIYKRDLERMKTISGYYQECLTKYKNGSNDIEKKLYKFAISIKRKFDAFDEVYDNVCKRERLLQSVGWSESITNDKKWNNIIVYADDNGNKISKDDAIKKMKELGITPAYTKYDIFV